MGHNEADRLRVAFEQVHEAARPGDAVWFVDSASTDGSAGLARSLGAQEVVEAPLGKGRAMAQALERCTTGHVCFVDGDLEASARNIPLTLRERLDGGPLDMVVAEFGWPAKRLWGTEIGVYTPLVAALFPEALGHVGQMPFSGFRILRTELDTGPLPAGFGIETKLNLLSATRRWRTHVVDVGDIVGPIRRKPELALEVAGVILDFAVAEGRLEPERRPAWDAWVSEVTAVTRTQPAHGESVGDYNERLRAVAGRSLPA